MRPSRQREEVIIGQANRPVAADKVHYEVPVDHDH
jgi:hypothetical protein